MQNIQLSKKKKAKIDDIIDENLNYIVGKNFLILIFCSFIKTLIIIVKELNH